jgi:hypothetical protein
MSSKNPDLNMYHLYLKSGARIDLKAYRVEFPNGNEGMLAVYTDPSSEEPDGGKTILRSEVAAVLLVDDKVIKKTR